MLVWQFERKPLYMSDTWANAHPTVLQNGRVVTGSSAGAAATMGTDSRQHDEV